MTLDEEDIGFHVVMPFLNRGIAEMNHEEKGLKDLTLKRALEKSGD